MAGRTSVRKYQERVDKCFEMHIRGMKQSEIAEAMSMTQQAVSRAVKKAATQHPLVQMTPEERAGVALALMQSITKELWQEIDDAKQRGARDELRSLLGISSLHAQRVSRVLLDQADVAISVVNVSESTVNSLAPKGTDCYQAWLQSVGPGALTAMPMQAQSSDRVIASETVTQGPDVPV
ncbi:hypothetical protein KR100_01940 [Synechococcus sp. KORDI-100]|nr:hypothetical protein KR100_01940 [Synechococcus sp. KORDI-100]